MIPSHQRQPARSGPVSAIQEQQSPTKFLRRWSKGRCVFITSLVVAGYVLSYPIFAILAYFNYISSEHGIGRVLEVFFIPLGYLEQCSEAISILFRWLTEIYSAPLFELLGG
jgi:hypothetical protein